MNTGERTGLLNHPAPPGRNPLHGPCNGSRHPGADRSVEPSTVRQLASCPPTPAAGKDDDTYVVIVIDTVAGEVDAYGPMTLNQATEDMKVLREELDADLAEFDGIAVRILELRPASRRPRS